MLTKNLSTLKINRLTQEQYDREKASGTLDDTALYFTPEEEIIVPTSLSQLSDDETHRLVTDTDKTAWNAKYDKPTGGIPKTDLASDIQTSLEKADESIVRLNNLDNFTFGLESKVDAHINNINVHIDSAERTAWNTKAEVFTIALSDGESGSLTTDKTFSEILEAYNSGKLLRITAEGGMLEGVFLAYAYNTFSFVFITNSTGVYITSDAVGTSPVPAFLPSASFSDKGKILTVDNNGDPTWADASASGSTGADVFMVTFTLVEGSTPDSMSFTADKTYAEIVAASEAGKIVRCSVLGAFFGQLSEVHNNYVTFGADSLGSLGSKHVFKIYSGGEVEYSVLSFYSPRFSQVVVSASGWSNGVYSFEENFPSTYYDIEVELDSTATSEQLDAWSKAKPIAVFNTNTMKALGDVPTVNIPVIVKLLFNPKMQKNGGLQ